MHQSSKRVICRGVFLPGCLVPTVAVAGLALHEHLPSTTRSRLATLEQILGVRLSAEFVGTTRPGVWQARDVVVQDPEHATTLAQLDVVTLDTNGALQRLSAPVLQLDPADVPALARLAHQRLASNWPGGVTFEVQQVMWATNEQLASPPELALRGSLGEYRDDTRQGRRLYLQASTAEQTDAVAVELFRHRQATPCWTQLQVASAGVSWPLAWLTSLGIGTGTSDADATFRGQLAAAWDDCQWIGQLQGEVQGIDSATAQSLWGQTQPSDGESISLCDWTWNQRGNLRVELATGGPLEIVSEPHDSPMR